MSASDVKRTKGGRREEVVSRYTLSSSYAFAEWRVESGTDADFEYAAFGCRDVIRER